MTPGDNDAWVDPSDPDIEAAADRILEFPGTVDRRTLADTDRDVAEITWIEPHGGVEEQQCRTRRR